MILPKIGDAPSLSRKIDIVWPAEIAPPERERETCGPEATITGLKER
jgi:hypothetical protein